MDMKHSSTGGICIVNFDSSVIGRRSKGILATTIMMGVISFWEKQRVIMYLFLDYIIM